MAWEKVDCSKIIEISVAVQGLGQHVTKEGNNMNETSSPEAQTRASPKGTMVKSFGLYHYFMICLGENKIKGKSFLEFPEVHCQYCVSRILNKI